MSILLATMGTLAAGARFAAISVSYPAGSVCTCSTDGASFAAGDNSGTWLFLVPKAGAWTISCSGNGQSASQTVSITTRHQAVNVTLRYWDHHYFKYGDQYTAITGGYTGQGYGTWSASDVINLLAENNRPEGLWVTTVNKVDLTPFSGIAMNIPWIGYDTDGRSKLFVSDTRNWPLAQVGATGTGVFSIDISGFSGSYYVGLTSSNNGSFNVDRIWVW